MSSPAGWYPQPDGRQRYWDGELWTERFAPGIAAGQPSRGNPGDIPAVTVPGSRARRFGKGETFGWGGLGLVVLLGALSSGFSGAAMMFGLFALVVGVIALARGRVGWARLGNRAVGGAALGTALVLIAVGAVAAPPSKPASVVAVAPAPSPSTPAATTPEVSATPSTETVATPAPTAVAPPTAPPTPTVVAPPTPTPTAAPTPVPVTPVPVVAAVAQARTGTALAAIALLTVKGRAPKTGYTRAQFGQAWFDADRNSCDTRNDILRRDLASRQMQNACKVLAGTLASDPYTGSSVRFVYGGAGEIDIDHVVALSDAWQKGAASWPAGKRLALANDPLNLLAVDASTNRSKGDGDTATWLPPNKSYRCTYVARQVAVKGKYGVWVTAAERDAMKRVLATCPNMGLPGPGSAPIIAALPKASTYIAPRAVPSPAPRPLAAPMKSAPAPRPAPVPVQPGGGATALCNDGTFSFAAHHRGACSHHHGVKVFYK